MPVPRPKWPRIVVSRQDLPEGPAIPFLVQLSRDRTRAQSRGKVAKDRLDYLGLCRIDATAASLPRHQIVAVEDTSPREPLQHATLETAPGLLGEILEEERGGSH
jgi:hypothetical protein